LQKQESNKVEIDFALFMEWADNYFIQKVNLYLIASDLESAIDLDDCCNVDLSLCGNEIEIEKEWRDTEDRDLLTGLWIVNTYQYPDLDYAKLNAEMHQIYFEVWTSFKNDLQPYDQVRIINNVLFNTLRFSANTKNFHSPSTSMLSMVLESKKGNPISLCSIYLLIAKKLGLPIYGVNLPNLFVLIYKQEDSGFYINAFNKGVIFSKEDIKNFLEQLKIDPQPAFFDPCSNLAIVLRFLKNLSTSFEKLGETDKADEVKELLEILGPQ
jgi:regulator of sirC expression with transglutaminase-like and TPR domain